MLSLDDIRYKLPIIIKEAVPAEIAEFFREQLIDLGADVDVIYPKKADKTNNLTSDDPRYIEYIKSITADSYDKAAFASYVLAQFENAVNFQSKSLHLAPNSQKRFVLAKYQVRNGNKEEAIKNLDMAINESPELLLGVFKEIDFVNEPAVVNLLDKKNKKINIKIKEEAEKWGKVESNEALEIINELTELSQKSYETKVSKLKSVQVKAIDVKNKINISRSRIESFEAEINNTAFLDFQKKRIDAIIEKLVKIKSYRLEEMQSSLKEIIDKVSIENEIKCIYYVIKEYPFPDDNLDKVNALLSDICHENPIIHDNIWNLLNNAKKEIEKSKLQIGSRYAGGIVFYLDNSKKHGLICSEEDLGKYYYGGTYKVIGANGNGIADKTGIENTRKITSRLETINISSFLFPWSWLGIIKKVVFKSSYTAAGACLEAKINGYNDWYLPTIKELELVYKNLYKNNLGNFKKDSFFIPFYWSSTENNWIYAFYFNFTNGTVEKLGGKNISNHVRAIRQF